MKQGVFYSKKGKYPLPLFFPDATRAVVKTLDSSDVKGTKTPGILVNTYHLYQMLPQNVLRKSNGIRRFMGWEGAVISDSGGFQVMSLVKRKKIKARIDDKGILIYYSKKRSYYLTPEKSIAYQIALSTDLVVVLDDFTPYNATRKEAEETVWRTIVWAERSKKEFLKYFSMKQKPGKRPYLIGVVQGGNYKDLREYCVKELVRIGFDGLGFGGWAIDEKGNFDYSIAHIIRKNTPSNYLLYGLGVGKPENIVRLVKDNWHIFDCVLPTRDARHKRLYVYNAKDISDISFDKKPFYSYYLPAKTKYKTVIAPVSSSCDCLLCTRYTRAYLYHLFSINDTSALRLATIHNLRFYSLLMERLKKSSI